MKHGLARETKSHFYKITEDGRRCLHKLNEMRDLVVEDNLHT